MTSKYLTVEETLTQTLKIWAVPNKDYDPKEEDSRPFRYEVRKGGLYDYDKPYQEGAVEVAETDVTVTVPGGVDLVWAAVQTLERARKEAREEWYKKDQEFLEAIDSLKMIEYQPEEEVVDD